MDIICNGEQRAVEESSTISDLVTELGLNPITLVAEVNGIILEQTDFTGLRLREGDKVELIRFVGGG